MIINTLKTLIKQNHLLTILFDYLMSKFNLNFEKEYELIKFIDKKNKVVIDVGGHKGESIINFLKHDRICQILSFEPIKSNYEIILKKINKNNVQIFNFGISNSNNKKKIYIPKIYNYRFTGLSSDNLKNLEFRLKAYFKKIYKKFSITSDLVHFRKLDDLQIIPDIIKIDVEGAELDVIKSGSETIIRHIPILIIEYNELNFDKIKNYLKKINYESFLYQKNTLKKFNKIDEEKTRKKSNLVNIVFVNNANKLKNLKIKNY